MQNKRGISQAFGAVPAGSGVRAASVFDVFAIHAVLAAAGGSVAVAPEGGTIVSAQEIRAWFEQPQVVRLALHNGQAAAAAAALPGRISLFCVAPDHTGRGLGRALLAELEAALRAGGAGEAGLDCLAGAEGFFVRHGWSAEGAGLPQGATRRMIKHFA